MSVLLSDSTVAWYTISVAKHSPFNGQILLFLQLQVFFIGFSVRLFHSTGVVRFDNSLDIIHTAVTHFERVSVEDLG